MQGAFSRGRQYQRSFDYEEARSRFATGERISVLAEEYGVSVARVRQVVIPSEGARADARSAAYRWPCIDCGAPTRSRNRRCVPCAFKLLATSAREDELLCMNCKTWKPDDDFPHNRTEKIGRRGRHGECRACQTVSRRRRRQANPEAQRAYDREYKRRRRAASNQERES